MIRTQWLVASILGVLLTAAVSFPVFAQGLPATQSALATQSGVASQSAEPVIATRAALLENTDITQTREDSRSFLRQQYDQFSRVDFSWSTPVRYAVQTAVERGIPLNTIVFLFLFPVISALIALTRHVIGLTGFSVYAPASLALALLSLGIGMGTVLFVALLIFAYVGKVVLPVLKLPYMPRTAMLLWFVSLAMFGVLVGMTFITDTVISTVNVFAVLILILLSEDFVEIQSARTGLVAIQRAVETFILGLISALIMGLPVVQLAVLRYAEVVLVSIAVGNFLIGRYVGLRLTEWFRFRSIMDTQEE